MRCLILGGTGRLGSHLISACAQRRWPHLSTFYQTPNSRMEPVDVRDADGVRELLLDYQPEVTFFAVPCDPAAGVRNVAEAVAVIGGKMVLVSDGEIFGDCSTAMREEDAVNADSIHAEAEDLVKAILPENHLILRSSGLFDLRTTKELAKRLRSKETIFESHCRFTMPTFAPDFAEVALDLIQHGQTGTIHAVGPERHSDFTFTRLVAHLLGYDADLIQPSEANPGRVWLDRFQLRQLLGPRAIRTAGEGLRALRTTGIPAPALRVAMAA
jgi:dTDP-4-dehydrorhamnose reductase